METETEGKTNAESNSYPQEAPESEDSKTAVEGNLDMAVVATLGAEKSDSNFIKVEGIKEDKPERLKMKIKPQKRGSKGQVQQQEKTKGINRTRRNTLV